MSKSATSVRLDWAVAANATTYHVYRADNPRMARGQLIATTSQLSLNDTSAVTDRTPGFYLVRGVNSGGVEGW